MTERRPNPAPRPNLKLSHPQEMGGLPFLGLALILLPIGALLILMIWAQTCGMGVICP